MASKKWSQAVKTAKGEVLEGGNYDLVVKTAKSRKSNDGAKGQVVLNLSVVSGPKAGEPCIIMLTLSPENPTALRIFIQTIGAFGLGEDFVLNLPEDDFEACEVIAGAIVGRGISAGIEVRDTNVGKRNQFQLGTMQPLVAFNAPVTPGPGATALPVPQPAPVPVPVPAPPAAPVAPPAPPAAGPRPTF